MVANYIPGRGDLIWVDFDPAKGREQQKRRPALVLTPESYSARTSLCLVVPITSKIKGYPWEVLLPDGLITKGVVLADHIRSVDWKTRNIRYIETVSPVTVTIVQGKFKNILL
jgi:mRNA interferase MazF